MVVIDLFINGAQINLNFNFYIRRLCTLQRDF